MMNFVVTTTTTISFDIENDLAETVLDYVLWDMWYDHPDKNDYDKLSEKQRRELIINTLETALEKCKNT